MAQGPFQSPQYPSQNPGYVPLPPPSGTNALAITAGVLLIVVSLIDLFGGIFYAFGGAFASQAGHAAEMAMDTGQADPQAQSDVAAVQTTGTIWQLFGFFLVVLFALAITAAIMLFTAKAPMFVMAVGGLQIVADIASCAMLKHIGVLNFVGVIAGVLAILGALSISKRAQVVPAM